MGTALAALINWARGVGAPEFFAHLPRLARMNGEPLPVEEFTLVEMKNHLCQFAGVGWDALLAADAVPDRRRSDGRAHGDRAPRGAREGPPGRLAGRACSRRMTKARAGAAKNVGPTRDRARAPAWPGVNAAHGAHAPAQVGSS